MTDFVILLSILFIFTFQFLSQKILKYHFNIEWTEKVLNRSFRIAVLIVIVVNLYGYTNYRHQIGSLWEADKYHSTYYVNLFPDLNTSKNYRVKAEISRFEGRYYIDKAYFPNGGYITFENDSWIDINTYEKTYLEDDTGKDWYIELTKERVKEQ